MNLVTSTNVLFRRPNGVCFDMLESLEYCAKAGYKFMDMNFVDASNGNANFIGDNWREWLYKIKSRADELNVQFVQAHSSLYNFCDPTISEAEHLRLNDLMNRSIEGASILGIPWIVVHPETDYWTSYPLRDSKIKNIEFYNEKLAFADRLNVGISFENMWDLNISPKRRYCVMGEELVELVEALAGHHDNLSICCDVEHLALMEQDFEREFNLYGNYLKMLHISDYNSIENDHILPFQGKIDWTECIRALKKANYQGDFTYEIHNYCKNIPDELTIQALSYSIEVGNYLIDMFYSI